MTSDLDIWRTAQALIAGYGDDAETEAEARAMSLARKGDTEGVAVWRRIGSAVKQLRQEQAPASAKLH